ncbi:MAG TPA: hypothetical protein VGH45_13265 [Solirubrobacteraceae bacterium]
MRLLTPVAIAAVISCSATPVALAARAGSQLGFAVDAIGFRSYFVFNARPGASVHGTLRVVSLTAGAKTVLVRPVDVSTAAAGGLQYGDHGPVGNGRWLTLGRRSVRVSGTGSARVPFTVRVPSGAGTGDHFMGITAVDRRVLAEHPSGHGAIRLRLIPRLAMTLELRLPGRHRSGLALGGVKVQVAPSGASLTFGISNPQNTLIPSTIGSVTVWQGGTPLFSRDIELASFVPRTAISYHVPWEGTPVQGTYRVTGELRPVGAPAIEFARTVTFGSSAIRQFRAQTGRSARQTSSIPIVLIVALALALAAAVALGVAYTTARRQIRRGV